MPKAQVSSFLFFSSTDEELCFCDLRWKSPYCLRAYYFLRIGISVLSREEGAFFVSSRSWAFFEAPEAILKECVCWDYRKNGCAIYYFKYRKGLKTRNTLFRIGVKSCWWVWKTWRKLLKSVENFRLKNYTIPLWKPKSAVFSPKTPLKRYIVRYFALKIHNGIV